MRYHFLVFYPIFHVFSPQTCIMHDRRSPAALRVVFRASGRALLYPQQPQAVTRSRARSKKEPKGCRTTRAMKGRCRYAKNVPDDRQFLSSRRHRHRLKIQFEKSNNTAQFARKCISRSSSDSIVCRVDTMRPIGWDHPGFLQRSPSATFFHYCSPLPPPRQPLHMLILFVFLQLFFPPTTVWLHACQV